MSPHGVQQYPARFQMVWLLEGQFKGS